MPSLGERTDREAVRLVKVNGQWKVAAVKPDTAQ